MQTILLNIFTIIALISAIMVIGSKNPIHSVVFLILVFCNATGLLLLLKLEFIAMMFLIIYVGAIAVLFLFVVMMLNIKINELNENWVRYLPIGGIISMIFILEIFLILESDFSRLYINDIENITEMASAKNGKILNETIIQSIKLYDEYYINHIYEKPWTMLIETITNIQSLGYLIYTYYVYYFIIASIILLVAMIGAIVLTMHKRNQKYASKKQIIYKQIERNFKEAISYVR